MFFVLLHGMSFSEYYSYSRKVLAGLVFSCIGDAFMVWSTAGYFIPGVAAFASAQVHCSCFLVQDFSALTQWCTNKYVKLFSHKNKIISYIIQYSKNVTK